MGGSDSADLVGLEVEALHRRGGTTTGRAASGGSAASRLVSGLDTAQGQIGHPSVRRALSAYLTSEITDHAHHLASTVTAAGHHVANVASTGRASDEAAARGLAPDLATAESVAAAATPAPSDTAGLREPR